MTLLRLTCAQRQPLIACIQARVNEPGRLEKTPDALLLAIQYALTGRMDDLIRHLSVLATPYRND